MTFSARMMAVETFVPALQTLSKLLDKGAEHAKAKGFDPTILVNARLAPDMFPLCRQVQIACDHAKAAAARLTGQEPPGYEDNERTLEALKARIDKTIAYIESIPAEAFAGAEERQCTIPLQPPLVLELTGGEMLRDWSLPNFYFHLVTAYDILRHSGVDLGKRDFMTHLGGKVKPRAS